ncbi:MAG: hypothetical protein HYW02_05285 [Deltaproteobacteria bacterium]|nr:hypothetical protein [Deltaproteobacteria bacterium]
MTKLSLSSLAIVLILSLQFGFTGCSHDLDEETGAGNEEQAAGGDNGTDQNSENRTPPQFDGGNSQTVVNRAPDFEPDPPVVIGCEGDDACPTGEICDNNHCRPLTCPDEIDCEEQELICNTTTGQCEAPPPPCEEDSDCSAEKVCNRETGECEVPHGCGEVEFKVDFNENKAPFFGLTSNLTSDDPTPDLLAVRVANLSERVPFSKLSIIGLIAGENVEVNGEDLWRFKIYDQEHERIEAQVTSCDPEAGEGDEGYCPGLAELEMDRPALKNYFVRYDLPVTGDLHELHEFLAAPLFHESYFWPVYQCGDYAPTVGEPVEMTGADVELSETDGCVVEFDPERPKVKVTMNVSNAVRAHVSVYAGSSQSEGYNFPIEEYGRIAPSERTHEFDIPNDGFTVTCGASGFDPGANNLYRDYTVDFHDSELHLTNKLLTGENACPFYLGERPTSSEDADMDDDMEDWCKVGLEMSFTQKVAVAPAFVPSAGAANKRKTSGGKKTKGGKTTKSLPANREREFSVNYAKKLELVAVRTNGQQNLEDQGLVHFEGCGPIWSLEAVSDRPTGVKKTTKDLKGTKKKVSDEEKAPATIAEVSPFYTDHTFIHEKRHNRCNKFELRMWNFGDELIEVPVEKETLDAGYLSELKLPPGWYDIECYTGGCNFTIKWKGQHLIGNPHVEIQVWAHNESTGLERWIDTTELGNHSYLTMRRLGDTDANRCNVTDQFNYDSRYMDEPRIPRGTDFSKTGGGSYDVNTYQMQGDQEDEVTSIRIESPFYDHALRIWQYGYDGKKREFVWTPFLTMDSPVCVSPDHCFQPITHLTPYGLPCSASCWDDSECVVGQFCTMNEELGRSTCRGLNPYF